MVCNLVYNEHASGFDKAGMLAAANVFAEKYDEVYYTKSDEPGSVVSLVKSMNDYSDLIVTYGGDGTFGEGVRGLQQTEQKSLYTHIPGGTANDMMRILGLCEDPVENAKRIINGKEQEIDLFTVNGVPMAYVAAFGFLANVPSITPEKLKAKFGYFAYLLTGVLDFLHKPEVYNITCLSDGERREIECITAIITNGTGFGGMTLLNNIDLNDGQAEISLIKNIKKRQMFVLAKDILLGKFDINKYPDWITHFKASDMKMIFNDKKPSRPIDLDGEDTDLLEEGNTLNLEYGKKLRLLLPSNFSAQR